MSGRAVLPLFNKPIRLLEQLAPFTVTHTHTESIIEFTKFLRTLTAYEPLQLYCENEEEKEEEEEIRQADDSAKMPCHRDKNTTQDDLEKMPTFYLMHCDFEPRNEEPRYNLQLNKKQQNNKNKAWVSL